ncbi:hypothetical protein BDP55DRAFT_650713 [Colletotrichum godetiae]|uniref:Uncharacterized protein n=1 Tax=Colletotrichum godetiae TaxID=1209918 RepID=A0AAJ0AWS1_9PEZI|nr:uncharacterized protein BDP55DRAFT_650713 [Colletotrichum godetiae]KAK1690436.1 hypothetical protein BDP55DRAFT_650713 [Colletotrichum godetiae]
MYIPLGAAARIYYNPKSEYAENIVSLVANGLSISPMLRGLAYEGSLGPWLKQYWGAFRAWLSQPQIIALVMTWAIVFTVVSIAILGLGFGPAGVGAGTLAAVFQSSMYGAFTPAGGLFATLTSMAMLGTLMPWAAVVSGVLATLAAGIVWGYGVGG